MTIKKDYITIGDIWEALDRKISRQGIYYYEAKGLIEPVIETGKIKLYSRDTIERVKKIKELTKTYHLKAIKEMLEKDGV